MQGQFCKNYDLRTLDVNKTFIMASNAIILYFKGTHYAYAFFLVNEWSSNKDSVTVCKISVIFLHIIRYFYFELCCALGANCSITLYKVNSL